MHFCAKSAKNDLKPTYSLKRNSYFEKEGIAYYGSMLVGGIHVSVSFRLGRSPAIY
jgi:hypothetical protein